MKFDLPHFTVLVLNQSSIRVVFAKVRFPFAPKSVFYNIHELMLNLVFHKMVPKLKEVQEDVDKGEEELAVDLEVMTLSVMEVKVLFLI